MPVIAVIVGLAALVWGAIYARRGSLTVVCTLLLCVGYVLGHEFWHARIGPIPVTLDRLLLAALLAMFVIHWRFGRLVARPVAGSDWLLGGLVLLVAASAAMSGQPEVRAPDGSTWGRLVASFVLPGLLYGVLRLAPLTEREWTRALLCLTGLGVYLAVTAVLEIAGLWSLVFPRYLADPTLGIHFGRARGPGLNAASLGLYLTACLWCAWLLVRQTPHRWQQLLLTTTLPLMALGVMLTYTRSTWLGLAASGLVLVMLQLPRRWRMPAATLAGAAAVLGLAVGWSYVVGLEREGSAAEAHHSVDQRTSFAYVSWKMFQDQPIFGVGFGRFYDRKLPYLSDRSQPFELESIRPLQHHNTLLSLLTETGMVGLAAFLGLLVCWTRYAWRLARSQDAPGWLRAQGVLSLALLTNYLCSAAFHDLTLVPTQHCLLFAFAGLTTNGWQAARAERTSGAAIPAAALAPRPGIRDLRPWKTRPEAST